MEPLIFLIIAAVVSAIIDKSKKKEQQQKSPKPTPVNRAEPVPETIEPLPERPSTIAMPKPLFPTEGNRPTFEEFAREILGELEPKQPEVVEVKPQPMPEVVQPVQRVRETMQERMEKSAVVDTTIKPIKVQKAPKRNDLIQAVIMAEVLGQPKSRKKHR